MRKKSLPRKATKPSAKNASFIFIYFLFTCNQTIITLYLFISDMIYLKIIQYYIIFKAYYPMFVQLSEQSIDSIYCMSKKFLYIYTWRVKIDKNSWNNSKLIHILSNNSNVVFIKNILFVCCLVVWKGLCGDYGNWSTISIPDSHPLWSRRYFARIMVPWAGSGCSNHGCRFFGH